jgi:hypothetical protein
MSNRPKSRKHKGGKRQRGCCWLCKPNKCRGHHVPTQQEKKARIDEREQVR